MTRRVEVSKSENEQNYTTIITGGPGKYYNRRRIRKRFAPKDKLYRYQPVTAFWFQTILQELAPARRRKNLSQLNLASQLGTSQAEISRIELGKTNPTVELLERLMTALDISIEVKIIKK